MRQLLIVLTTLALYVQGCDVIDSKKTALTSVAFDITDTPYCKPNSDEIASTMGIDEDENCGYAFRLFAISDVSFNKVFSVDIKSVNRLLSNPYNRDTELDTFLNRFYRCIENSDYPIKELPHSNIYVPVVRELNKMAHFDAHKKVFIIYSNCIENSSIYSYISEPDSNIEAIKQKFLKVLKPDDLTSIEVHIIYEPKNQLESDEFEKASCVIRQILESAGAIVHVGANIG